MIVISVSVYELELSLARVARQFMPNWNSWTRPVATPIATLISRSLPKNRVRRASSG